MDQFRVGLLVTSSVVRREEAEILEARVAAPLLTREHIWYVDPKGSVLYGKSVFRGDRHQMFVEFAATPPAGTSGT